MILRACIFTLCLGVTAAHAEETAWETVQEKPLRIKVRQLASSDVKEVWAEGEMAVRPEDIEAVIMDPDRYPKFMPYCKESRTLGKPDPDGSAYVYTRLDFGSLVTSRDYVVKVAAEKTTRDGGEEFKNRWEAVPDRLPKRANSIRLRRVEGSWHAVPRGEDKSFVTYRFVVDPGGWIPSFAANLGNKQGVTETFQAVEKEAQRRARERREDAASSQVP